MEHGIRIRTFILLWLILFGGLGIKAQSYHALPDSNATWIVTEVAGVVDVSFEYGLSTFLDDTIINSISYNKIFLKGISDETYYVGAFRNDTNGRTYFVPALPSMEEYLWYDFNLDVGDTAFDVALNGIEASFYGTYNLIVDSIKYLDAGPYNLKCLFLSPLPPNPPWIGYDPLIWVEKIGNLNGGIFNMYISSCWPYLSCMSADDTIYYFSTWLGSMYQEIILSYEPGICELPPTSIAEQKSDHGALEVYPNPFTISTTIEYELTEPSHVQLTIYNAIGEIIHVADEDRLPPGKHTYVWTPEGLSEGLYYAVLRSEEGVSVVKILKQ